MVPGKQLLGLIVCVASVAAATADVTFTDDFNDQSFDPMSWTATTGTGLVVLEENGYLRVGNGSFSLDAYAQDGERLHRRLRCTGGF